MTSNSDSNSLDLLSIISGSAQDFKLILDYLPAYLPQFTHFHNVMLGISLGGHTAYHLASLAPAQIEGYVIAVGCPNLTSLLLSRLGVEPGIFNTTLDELNSVNYDKLEKTMHREQRRRWPRALAELVREGDRKVYEEFPEDVPVLICNGKHDPLVPAFHTASWLEKRRTRTLSLDEDETIKLFVQENTGHSYTMEMVAMTAAWLGTLFERHDLETSMVHIGSHL
jgi:pimeloyl-ACP methyl ester carboxylesterase